MLRTHIDGENVSGSGQNDRKEFSSLAKCQDQVVAYRLHDLNGSSEVAMLKILSQRTSCQKKARKFTRK